ncbi:hypothetical protein [Tsukamurella paurometabola]|uniref:DUF1330 domain-containing protein n=1 Tax=Tsukamurella paurometabola TaxID=2061 RepID=A0A3P8L4G6_TSUPA|nr:hypothetical protein [Tsukamurella paurometabola]MBS4103045.1 hypothetical protein [Tsukamurella paurometabola]UEA84863.1 hypothetical protein LK411_08615 [Tsukamurella paurometabola]VDR37451.1 Uncharacterised protein [Tsukamurella paurometabola]
MDEPAEVALQLCCLLWARPGLESALTEYEDAVLALLPEHGGIVVQRAIGAGGDGQPNEVQLYRFPDRSALDGYLSDPRRLALTGERDRVIARTELFPVSF